MVKSKEEITEKYLLLALEELSKHRGSIKKGRAIEHNWHKEILYNQVLKDREVTAAKNTAQDVLKQPIHFNIRRAQQ